MEFAHVGLACSVVVALLVVWFLAW
jgi:hypothetical protein